MKNAIYSFIHTLSHIIPPKSRESRRFFLFFTAASILEFTLAKIVLYLSDIGAYDPFTALKIAPVMTESAVITLFLTIVASVILDFNIKENSSDS